jgi:sugar phosphate isomerase/epimerase
MQLLADSYHMGTLGEPYSHILDAGARLKHVHIDTHVMPGLVGGNTYDLAAFLTALKQAGYIDRVSVEDHSGMLNVAQTVSREEMYRMMYGYVAARMPA